MTDLTCLERRWRASLQDSGDARGAWHATEGGPWEWQPEGPALDAGADWRALRWDDLGPEALGDLGGFAVEVTVRGRAAAAGLSLGPYKDFLAPLDGPAVRLRLEVCPDAGTWRFTVDGRPSPRAWWDRSVTGVADLLDGNLFLKAHRAGCVRFSDLQIRALTATTRLAVVVTCHRFLQRLRVSLRNWCLQDLPPGSLEVLVAHSGTPEGTGEYVATVARAFPAVRVAAVPVPPGLARNKGAMTNRAVEQSTADWVWLTDADCVFPPGSVDRVLAEIAASGRHLYYGRRRHLTAEATDALIAGRSDAFSDFARIATAGATGALDEHPWGYTQIVPRDVLSRIPYPEQHDSFAYSDEEFLVACRRRRLVPRQVPGLECLHLAHPFVWYANDTYL